MSPGLGFAVAVDWKGGHGFGHSSILILGGGMATSMPPGLGFAVAGISAPSCHAETPISCLHNVGGDFEQGPHTYLSMVQKFAFLGEISYCEFK